MSTNDFIDDFIEEYKNQPCLWKADSSDYKNRCRRQEAYMKLIEVASKHGEHYNIERTKQKINNLRCAFRHQLKKFTELKNNKTGKDEPYCPKRRYFESLMFLMEEEKPANRFKLAERLKEIKMTRVITRRESPTQLKKEYLEEKSEPMNITIENIENSNGGGEQQEEVIELDREESQPHHQHHHHQMETTDMQEENENCTVHSEDISVAGESVKEAGGVVYHTDVQQSDDEEEGFKILWPVGQSKPIDGIHSNYIRMAPPSHSPQGTPPSHSQNSTTSATISTPLTTIIHHDLTNTGHTSSTTQISLPTSITIQPVPKHGDTVISTEGMQHSAIRRRSISACSVKSQSMGPAENNETSQEPPLKKVKIDCSSSDFEKLLTLACSKMNAPDPQPEDSFATFGKIVAHKMRTMDSQQALFAEKIIFDILFDGQMKQLKYPYSVSTQYGIGGAIPVSRSTLYPIRHSGNSTAPGSIVSTSSQQPQTFVISSVDCHGTPTEIHATNSAHQTHYSPHNAHYATTTISETEVEEQL